MRRFCLLDAKMPRFLARYVTEFTVSKDLSQKFINSKPFLCSFFNFYFPPFRILNLLFNDTVRLRKKKPGGNLYYLFFFRLRWRRCAYLVVFWKLRDYYGRRLDNWTLCNFFFVLYFFNNKFFSLYFSSLSYFYSNCSHCFRIRLFFCVKWQSNVVFLRFSPFVSVFDKFLTDFKLVLGIFYGNFLYFYE